jgi:hypothetical protein
MYHNNSNCTIGIGGEAKMYYLRSINRNDTYYNGVGIVIGILRQKEWNFTSQKTTLNIISMTSNLNRLLDI